MKTKWLLAGSALVLGAAGLAGLFLPHELLRALRQPYAGVLPVLVQLHAALLLGFAIANWTAKDSRIGGIYNRPLALGNLMHFVVGAITLCKFVIGGAEMAFFVTAVIYVAFALGFAKVTFAPARGD